MDLISYGVYTNHSCWNWSWTFLYFFLSEAYRVKVDYCQNNFCSCTVNPSFLLCYIQSWYDLSKTTYTIDINTHESKWGWSKNSHILENCDIVTFLGWIWPDLSYHSYNIFLVLWRLFFQIIFWYELGQNISDRSLLSDANKSRFRSCSCRSSCATIHSFLRSSSKGMVETSLL